MNKCVHYPSTHILTVLQAVACGLATSVGEGARGTCQDWGREVSIPWPQGKARVACGSASSWQLAQVEGRACTTLVQKDRSRKARVTWEPGAMQWQSLEGGSRPCQSSGSILSQGFSLKGWAGSQNKNPG